MKEINQDTWKRKEIFDFYSGLKNPFYALSFPLDVTPLYQFCHRESLSFYYSLTYLTTKAVNNIENFRYAIRDQKVVLLDERYPSFTDSTDDPDLFRIITLKNNADNVRSFCENAKEAKEQSRKFIEADDESDDLIYISCVPWLNITSLSNTLDKDADSNIPSITWGKYVDLNGRKTLNITVEVSHRFVDGYHIGQFGNTLQDMINSLGDIHNS